uniref:Uncharacterized protein n=1 Tax=Arundo donax TaxID=35708 RepID=A0A0A9DXR7_ARUDO
MCCPKLMWFNENRAATSS